MINCAENDDHAVPMDTFLACAPEEHSLGHTNLCHIVIIYCQCVTVTSPEEPSFTGEQCRLRLWDLCYRQLPGTLNYSATNLIGARPPNSTTQSRLGSAGTSLSSTGLQRGLDAERRSNCCQRCDNQGCIVEDPNRLTIAVAVKVSNELLLGC